MGNGFQFLDIVFFALVAGFLILRLRSVLGRRTGNERPPESYAPRSSAEAPIRPVPKPDNARGETPDREPDARLAGGVNRRVESQVDSIDTSPLAAGLTKIRIADPAFDPDRFLTGARAAFEMIVAAFARGDNATLRPLLNDDVFAQFNAAIAARKAAGHSLETTLVQWHSATITDATIDGRIARVSVKFATQQINLTRDSAGNVVDGDPNAPVEVIDLWTFARDTRADDPNWALVATATPG